MHYVNTFEEQNFRYLHVNISIIPGLGKKPGLRPKPGRAKPEPLSMARLKVLESPSPQKPEDIWVLEMPDAAGHGHYQIG